MITENEYLNIDSLYINAVFPDADVDLIFLAEIKTSFLIFLVSIIHDLFHKR